MKETAFGEHLLNLNPTECFLKDFIRDYPQYQKIMIGLSGQKESEYEQLMYLMRKEWKRKMPDQPFCLEGSSYCLMEDFFIQEDENVSVWRNLRYMPYILHSHQFIELNYVYSGCECYLRTRDQKLRLQDGDIVLCPPGLSHCFDVHHDQGMIIDIFIRISTFDTAFFNLLSDNHYLSAMFSNALYSPRDEYILWHCPKDSYLQSYIISCLQEYESDLKFKNRMTEVFVMQLFLHLLRHYETQAIFSSSGKMSSDEQFQALMNYMRAHYQTITLAQLADQYNYSERQIIRLLKKHSGKNFSQLHLDIRMKKALQLLNNPSITLSQIASMLGFSSSSYFSHVFEKYYSCTIEAFRSDPVRNIRQNHPD